MLSSVHWNIPPLFTCKAATISVIYWFDLITMLQFSTNYVSQFWFVLTIGWLFCNYNIQNNPSKISQYEIVTCSVTHITGGHMWRKRCQLWHQFCHMCAAVTLVARHVTTLHCNILEGYFTVGCHLSSKWWQCTQCPTIGRSHLKQFSHSRSLLIKCCIQSSILLLLKF